MTTLRHLANSIQAIRGVLFANEGTEKGSTKFDFRKMVLDLLGMKADATDEELNEACNACLKDDTDYAKMAANCDEAKAKIAANEAELATLKASIDTLTKERDAANEKINVGEGQLTAVKAERDAAIARATKAETDFANEVAKVTALVAERDAANGKATTAEATVANERKAFADAYLALGVESGRISGAEKATWEKDFANSADYAATAAKLVKLPAKWKTVTAVNGLGSRSTENLSRIEKVSTMVNERMAANAKSGKRADYDFCFAQVKQENPGLFEQMVQPEASKNVGKRK